MEWMIKREYIFLEIMKDTEWMNEMNVILINQLTQIVKIIKLYTSYIHA